jgi:hypothetical protein
MALRCGTSNVLNVVKPHTIQNMVIYYIRKINARNVILFQKINVNLTLYIKMVTKRIKRKNE